MYIKRNFEKYLYITTKIIRNENGFFRGKCLNSILTNKLVL